jgi:phage minor structural protein, N-terminal region
LERGEFILIPVLYNSNETDFTHNGLGVLADIDKNQIYVERERNGTYLLNFRYPEDGLHSDLLENEMIIKVDASPRYKNQLFRIYYIGRSLGSQKNIYAEPIFYDCKHDALTTPIDGTMTCQEALNQLRNKCVFSLKRGTMRSDLPTASYYQQDVNTIMECIVGKEGSIVQTFGNGPDLIIDNFDLTVVQHGGEDNGVTVTYEKNLTGFEMLVDSQDKITALIPYVKYNDEDNKEHTIYGDMIKTTNYSEELPYIYYKDFSDKFQDDQGVTQSIPTVEEINNICDQYMRSSTAVVDIDSLTYEISFQPLANTEQYRDLRVLEELDLLDTVVIQNEKMNVVDSARVVKTKYNPVTEQFISMTLGQPNTTLGQLITDQEKDPEVIQLKRKVNNIAANGVKFPDDLPDIKDIQQIAVGMFFSVTIKLTQLNQPYWYYQIYASQVNDFIPASSNLVYEGPDSGYFHEVKPNQTWYYKIRIKNCYDHYTEFLPQINATTAKISDGAQYFEEAAIASALIGNLMADKITGGVLDFNAVEGINIKGENIIARNFTATDDEGNITMKISSDGVLQDMTLYMRDAEGIITSYATFDGNGFSIFKPDGTPICYINGEGSYLRDLKADHIDCDELVHFQPGEYGEQRDFYVFCDENGNTKDGYYPSIQSVISYIRNSGNFCTVNNYIHVMSGSHLTGPIYLEDIAGKGVFKILFEENTSITLTDTIYNGSDSRLELVGPSDNCVSNDSDVSDTELAKWPVIYTNGFDLTDARLRGGIEISGFKVRNVGEQSGTCIVGAYSSGYAKVTNCDVYNFDICVYTSGGAIGGMYNCRGDKVNHVFAGYDLSVGMAGNHVPNYTSDFVYDNGVAMYNCTANDCNKRPTKWWTTAHLGTDTGSTNVDSVTIDSCKVPQVLENLYTTVSGSGRVTSARKGYTGQGNWYGYKNHTGHATIPNDVSNYIMKNEVTSIRLIITRLDTGHGYAGAVPHPVIKVGSTTWDSNTKFSRGQTQTIELPSSIVGEIKNGAKEMLFVGTGTQQYSYYNNLKLEIETKEKVSDNGGGSAPSGGTVTTPSTGDGNSTDTPVVVIPSTDWRDTGRISKAGFRFIKGMEGFYPFKYQDSGGYWTIGYGVTYIGEKDIYNQLVSQSPLTEEVAAKTFYSLVNSRYAAKILSTCKSIGLTKQCQFDALISLAYNAGTGTITGTNTLMTAIRRDPTDEAKIRSIWERFKCTSNGVYLSGLAALRKQQCNMFFGQEFETRKILQAKVGGGFTYVSSNNGNGWLPDDDSYTPSASSGTPPVVNNLSANVVNGLIHFTFSVADADNDISKVYYKIGSSNPWKELTLQSSGNYEYTYPESLGSGTFYIYAKAEDTKGNTSTVKNVKLVVTDEGGSGTTETVVPTISWVDQNHVTVTKGTNDLKGILYSTDNYTWSSMNISSSGTYTLNWDLSAGSYTLYVYAMDILSNVSTTITKSVTIESTSTTIKDFSYPDELVDLAKTYWTHADDEYDGSTSWSQGTTYRASNTPMSGVCNTGQSDSDSIWVKYTSSGKTRNYKAIDCSTFVGLVLRGWDYSSGPYASASNCTTFRNNGKPIKSGCKWGLAPDRSAADIGKFFAEDSVRKNWVLPSKDPSTFKKGDIVFWSKKNSDGTWVQPDRYKQISHVGIVYEVTSEGPRIIESTNVILDTGKKHTLTDGTEKNCGVVIRKITYVDNITMAVRLQF